MIGKRGMILCNDKYINKKSLYTIRQSLNTGLPRMRKLIMHIRASFCYMRKENTKFACIIFAMKIIDNAQKCILHFIHIVHMNRVHPKMIKVRNAIMLIIVILHLIVIR